MRWLILLALLLFALPARAGVVVGVLGGAEVPLSLDSASSTSPAFGLLGGYRVGLGPIKLQPELVAHLGQLNGPSTFTTLSAGGAFMVGNIVRTGIYAHAGYPLAGGYPSLTGDAGLLGAVAPFPGLEIGLRAGYRYVDTIHMKCGNCPQPAEHYAGGLLTGSYEF